MAPSIEILCAAEAALAPAPIPQGWIVEGTPYARAHLVFRSADRRSFTMLWHCTAGTFRWLYREDETIQLLAGGMTLRFEDGTERSCAAGDLVFFPAGSRCTWVIETEVRKLAFLREAPPAPLGLLLRVLNRLRRMFQPQTDPFAAAPAPAG